MKKFLALTLSVLMLASVLAGCSKKENPTDTPSTASGVDTSKEVTLKWMYHGSNVTDDADVMKKVNEYLKEKINAKLEMIWCTWADFDERVLTSINGGDDIDIYFTSSWTPNNEYAATAKKGAYVRLDNPENNLLEKVAPNLFSSLHPALADAAMTEGADGLGIYAIPTYKEVAQLYTWDINVAMLAKYGYTPDDVKSYYDLGPILEAIKQGEGTDFYPLNPEPAVLERMVTNSDIVDSDSLLTYQFNPENPSQSGVEVKSRFETPEYQKYVEQTREYYLKGYINPLMSGESTMVTAKTDADLAARYAIGTQVYAPGYELVVSKERGTEIVMKGSHTPIISTTSARGAMHAVSTMSKNPDRALMLLNLVNTDPYLATLLEYGIEGVHYNTKEDGRIEFVKEKRDLYTPWRNGLLKLTLLPVSVDEPTNQWELFEDFNSSAQGVPITGWAFDASPVENELAALASVRKEFGDALNAGAVDPAEKLPEFIEKLKANGIDKVVEEANNQIKAFLANK